MASTNPFTASSAAISRKNVTRKKKHRGTRPSTTSASRITPEGVDRYVHYVKTAKTRWLNTEEVYDILCNYQKTPIQLSEKPPTEPVPGQLYLFDRRVIKFYKKDQLNYVMRKDQPASVKEEFATLKINGEKKLGVAYAKSYVVVNANHHLCRRCFKRIDVKEIPPITLVQYFANPIKKPRKYKRKKNKTTKQDKINEAAITKSNSNNGQRVIKKDGGTNNNICWTPTDSNDTFSFGNVNSNFSIDTRNNTMDGLDMKWDVGDFSFADDEDNDVLVNSKNDNANLYYDIVDYSPEELYVSNTNPKKEYKVIIVTRLMNGFDESIDLFMEKNDIYVAIEYGVGQNANIDFIPLQVLSVDTYKLSLGGGKVNRYIEQTQLDIVENNTNTINLKLYLMRKVNVEDHLGTSQTENIQCSDKFILHLHFENTNVHTQKHGVGDKSGPSIVIRNKKRLRDSFNAEIAHQTMQNSDGANEGNFTSSRQFKVRMIETMNRLAANNTSNNVAGDVDLDTLEIMDDQQLHQMTESLVMQVVTQLSDMADKSTDGQLRQELLAIDENGYNLLHILCINNSPSSIPIILKVISKEGNDAVLNAVNTPTRNGMCPLHLAAMNGYIKCVNQLIQAGAIVTVRNQNGLQPHDIALKNGHTELAEILQRKQENQNQTANPMIMRYLQSLDSPPTSLKERIHHRQQHQQHDNSLNHSTLDYNHNSPRSPPRSYGEENKAFLADALQNLSLQDKCALKIGLESLDGGLSINGSTNTQNVNNLNSNVMNIDSTNSNGSSLHYNHKYVVDSGIGVAMGQQSESSGYSGNEDELFSDVASVLSEADIASVISNESEQLDIVISAMNSDEKEVVDEEVVKIQKNVKRWLMQKNFETIRAAAKKLSSRRHAILTRRQFMRKKKAATALQAAARGLRDRREFEQIRQKASATLIINKHVREWLRRKKDETRLETVDEMELNEVDDNSSVDNKH
jgi:ankyrin repeat protein